MPLDQDYRPTAIEDANSGGLSLGFGYDAVGNLTQLSSGSPPPIEVAYDALGRLTETRDSPTQAVIDAYSYDATGNRTAHTTAGGTSAYVYPAISHRLSEVAGVARDYDAVGNTTAIGGAAREFVYNDANRMSQVKQGGVAVMNYAYNGRGEQVRKHVGTANTYTVYDEAGHWLGDYDGTGAPLQQALWMDDLPVGLLANGNQLHYVEPDHLGSPRVVIDVARNVPVWTWDLKGEAFGSTAPDQDADGDSIPFVFDMRFPGQRFDVASGLNYNYYRDYTPDGGRYVQSDPIGLEGGISTYGYVGGGPLIGIDPSGLIYGDGILEWDDVLFGPTYWIRKKLGLDPSLDCLDECIRSYDPLSEESKIGLSGVGGTFPKSWVGLPRGLGGASTLTTVPSAIVHRMGGGGAKTVGGLARGAGRVASPIWISYGVYLAGVESYCAARCADRIFGCVGK